MKRTSTYFPKPGQVPDSWRVIDATGRPLGRLARDVAVALLGKDKPTYTPHVITGDHVVGLNATRVMTTGKKQLQKTYYRHSEYPGGIRETTAAKMREKKPTAIVQLAVKGMLPRNRLSRELLRKLKIYPGPEHPHEAQNPQPLVIGG